ncbi:MAG: hypothetical protein GY786_10590 [Proteobacteria bacterium]|nr:hypothetical protein [Pseudomonadota bacterium]
MIVTNSFVINFKGQEPCLGLAKPLVRLVNAPLAARQAELFFKKTTLLVPADVVGSKSQGYACFTTLRPEGDFMIQLNTENGDENI